MEGGQGATRSKLCDQEVKSDEHAVLQTMGRNPKILGLSNSGQYHFYNFHYQVWCMKTGIQDRAFTFDDIYSEAQG